MSYKPDWISASFLERGGFFFSRDFGLLSAPLSYVRSGDYGWGSTGLNVRGSYGYYWTLHSDRTTFSTSLVFYSALLSFPNNNHQRGGGFAVRCVSSFLHPRLRPSQRPIIVCEEWQLLLGLYGAYQQRFTRLLLVASFQHYYGLRRPVLLLVLLEPSERLRSRKRVCGDVKIATLRLA